ncbi:Phosphatidic acid phosphatase type 2/haloperoxidase [Dillenia turbinata]|uniref:Phosphatidic acid phosphatase type 2/haloperoxidase n=1 Tax=Dillenia turbinata TaxID=194707 RepID=A0AAN8Z312_9MAGN
MFAFSITHQPKINLFICGPNYFKPISSTSKLIVSGGFNINSKKLVSEKKRVRNNWKKMAELVRVSAYGSSSGSSSREESVGILEEEAVLLDGSSSQIGLGFSFARFESTLNRLSKWIVAALFGAVVLCRHDPEALWAAMGSVANAGLSIILKRILNQERPSPTRRSDPGMPSSHAQSIFFTVMFSILSVVEWLGVNDISLIISTLTLIFGSYLSWLRVSQQLHTVSQVLVGAAVGSIFSILWFWSWFAFVLEAFISYLWVRVVVVLGAFGFCLGFVIHVIRHWLKDDR